MRLNYFLFALSILMVMLAFGALLFVAFDPIPPNLPMPVIRAEPDSVRKEDELVLDFGAPETQ